MVVYASVHVRWHGHVWGFPAPKGLLWPCSPKSNLGEPWAT